MTARAQHEPFSALATLGRTLWAWRLEAALVAALAIAYALLAQAAGAPFAVAVLILVLLVGAVAARRRPSLRRPFHAARVRRSLLHALDAGDSSSSPTRPPRVRSVQRVPAGDLVTVQVARGRTVAELEQRAEQLAAAMRLHDVRVSRDRSNASRGTVLLMRRDPFNDPTPLPWPPLSAILGPDTGLTFSLWDPILLGIDDMLGEPVTITLPGKHLIVGGEPEGGKSATVALLAAAAALSDARLYVIDGGDVDGAAWAPVADVMIGADRPAAIKALEKLHVAVDKRRAELLRRGQRKVTRDDADWAKPGMLIIDEAPFFLNSGPKDEHQLFTDLLTDLMARCRKVALNVVIVAQRPATDSVPAAIRDLCSYRFALRCSTKDASDTILGRGWASAGYDASTIDSATRGVGLLLAEGGQPRRIRTFYLSDDDLLALVEKATSARLDRATRPETTMPASS